jgi:hypothetical protein
VGRASNRKKAARQGQGSTAQARRRAVAVARRALAAMEQERLERGEDISAAALEWCGDAGLIPADRPGWPAGSLGDRFFSCWAIEQARAAPSLRLADIPPSVVIADDPAHWNVAMDSLIRAIVFDGLTSGDPLVRRVAGILAPIAADELAYAEAMQGWNFSGALSREDPPEFPELDGPVFLLGGSALIDAMGAVAGDEPLEPVRQALLPVLDGVVPGVDGSVLADALLGAFGTGFTVERPEDREALARPGKSSGNSLEDLVTSGVVTRAAVLPVGLRLLAALTKVCQSGAASLPQAAGRAAGAALASGKSSGSQVIALGLEPGDSVFSSGGRDRR